MRISDWSSGVCSSDLEYGRIGFQGGLQYYRVVTGGHLAREMKTFAGRAIEVPSLFIAGSSDWGTHQKPGEFEAMQARGLKDLRGVHLIDGAGTGCSRSRRRRSRDCWSSSWGRREAGSRERLPGVTTSGARPFAALRCAEGTSRSDEHTS